MKSIPPLKKVKVVAQPDSYSPCRFLLVVDEQTAQPVGFKVDLLVSNAVAQRDYRTARNVPPENKNTEKC